MVCQSKYLQTIYRLLLPIITAFIDAVASTAQLYASYSFQPAFDATTDPLSQLTAVQTLSILVQFLDRCVSVCLSASEPASERTNGLKSRRSPLQTLYDGDQVSLSATMGLIHPAAILVLNASRVLELTGLLGFSFTTQLALVPVKTAHYGKHMYGKKYRL